MAEVEVEAAVEAAVEALEVVEKVDVSAVNLVVIVVSNVVELEKDCGGSDDGKGVMKAGSTIRSVGVVGGGGYDGEVGTMHRRYRRWYR